MLQPPLLSHIVQNNCCRMSHQVLPDLFIKLFFCLGISVHCVFISFRVQLIIRIKCIINKACLMGIPIVCSWAHVSQVIITCLYVYLTALYGTVATRTIFCTLPCSSISLLNANLKKYCSLVQFHLGHNNF